MSRYKLVVAYDGSGYAGWQVQRNANSVQGKLEAAAAQITGEKVRMHGSGRTDRGVHARGQAVHCDIHKPVVRKALRRGLNAVLPPDIRILRVTKAADDFDARRHAAGKEYRYFIWNDEVIPPFHRFYKTHVRKKLDVEAMRRAAAYLVGRHDFAAFTANPRRETGSTVRRVTELSVRKSGSELVIIARGEGFLYKMVRSFAGYLIRVGEGKLAPSSARAILSSRVRTARVRTAPPEGLFLWKVDY